MKELAILLLCFFFAEQYILINDILYKMPTSDIDRIKLLSEVTHKEVFYFNNKQDTCFAKQVEWIEIREISRDTKKLLSQYAVDAYPLFLYESEFVEINYFNPEDIVKLEPLSKNVAISKYGCLGLRPLFNIILKEGKTKKDKPTGGIMLQKTP